MSTHQFQRYHCNSVMGAVYQEGVYAIAGPEFGDDEGKT